MGELNVLSRSERPIGTIATLYQGKVAGETLTSYMRMDTKFARGRDPDVLYIKGSQVPAQRNAAVHRMRGDWLVFVDSDMEFEPDAVKRLVASYHELKTQVEGPVIVGGLCTRRYPPFQPTMFKAVDMEEGPFRVIEEWEDADYVECDATGMAFVLIEREAFEAIMGGPMPPIEEREQLVHPWPFFEWFGHMGEDLRFCLKARKAGVRVFVDPAISVGHVAEVVVDVRDYWRYMAAREDKDYKDNKMVNDYLELPTLTREKALELLG